MRRATETVDPPAASEPRPSGRTTKRRRYGRYGGPAPLLAGRRQCACAVFSASGRPGCAEVDGPCPFGSSVRLPAPFDLEFDTGRF